MGCSGSRAVGEDDEDPPSAPTKQLQTEAISVTPRGGLGGSADGALPSGGMGSGDPSARRSSHSAYGSGGEGASGGAGAAPAMGGAGGPTERRGSTTRHIPGTAGRRASYHENVKLTEQYILGKVLGKGGFGEVRAGARKLDGRRVAIKIISKIKFASAEDRANMMTEVDLMRRVRGHANVVEFLEAFEDKANFSIVCELCTGGELMDRILASTSFSEKDASRYFRQMASGVQHCHRNGVVHRDLKPENFLFHTPEPDSELALMDFGLSCRIASPDEVMTEGLGSAYYIAPEVFRRRYTRAIDAWALGVILYLLLSGEVPFGHEAQTENEVYRAIQESPLKFGPSWLPVTSAAKELIQGLLEKDPTKRYTVDQALAHPWVSGEGVAAATPLDKTLLSSLLKFSNNNKMRKRALALVANKLSANDVRGLRDAFCKIDVDNTGFITYPELKEALKEAGFKDATDEEVEAMLKTMDADGDGTISWQEFLEATAERQLINYQQQIWETFCELDVDGSGSISVDELRKVLKDEPPEVIQKYIDEFDADGNGEIDYQEFVAMLLPKDVKYRVSAAR